MEWNETSAKLDAVSIMIVATRVRRILCARGTAFLGLSVSFRCCGLLDLWDLRLIFSCCIVDATCSFDPSLPLGRDREEGGLISFSSVTGSNRNLRVEAKHPFHVMYLLSRILTAGFWNQPCLGTWMRTRM